MSTFAAKLRVSLGVALLCAVLPAEAQWLQAGSGAPTNSSGVESAWYLDTATGKLYGPYTTNAWPASTQNLTTWLAALSGAVAPGGTWTLTQASPALVAASLPTPSTCGTNPSVAAGSSSNGGQFTLGTANPTACTITFATPFPTAAFCTVSPASSGGAAITGGFYISAQSKTAFTLTLGTGTSSLVFNYNCEGN